MNGEGSERRRSNVDKFLNQPQVNRNPQNQVPASINRTVDDGKPAPGIPNLNNSRSQDRYSANPDGKITQTPLTINIGGRRANNAYDDAAAQANENGQGLTSMTARQPQGRNNSASMAGGQSRLTGSVAKNLRPLPIFERENVFNEWGAVIKHQDEIDRELKRQQVDKYRERQKNYKMQLDQQYNEMMAKKKGSLSQQAKREDELHRQYQRSLEDKQRQEDDKKHQLLTQQKAAANESINELSIMKRQQRNINEIERQLYSDKLRQQEQIENQRKNEEKEKAKTEQMSYHQILSMQHKSKVDKFRTEKEADRRFFEAEKKQLEKQDDQRNQFFQKLSNIQQVNDLKQKKLQEYMEQDPKEIRSKQDEINYIKNLEVVERNNQMKEFEQKNKKNFDQVSNYQSLANQLKERELQKVNAKAQENAIASYYNQEADKYRLELEEQKQRKQRVKDEYNRALASQITENNKRKQYSVLMSEHEKRVNDRDIKAFQHNDTNLHSKVIGFSGDNRLDKYIDKSMGVPGAGSGSNYASPAPNSDKAANLNQSYTNGSNSNLAKMGRMSLNKSTNILTDQPDPPRVTGDQSYPIPKLMRVRDNMQKEDAMKYRANTNNKGYGFEQALRKHGVAGAVIPTENDANPYEYVYSAPGNH